MIHTGIDIIKIERISSVASNPLAAERVFTDEELSDPRPEHLAGIFALKEAFYKATHVKMSRWSELAVRYRENKPYIVFDGSKVPFRITSCSFSISHDGEYAVAIAVVESED